MKDQQLLIARLAAVAVLLVPDIVTPNDLPDPQPLTRSTLIERSDFIFAGWPTQEPAVTPCAHQTGRWQVQTIYRGDRSLQGKIVALAAYGYRRDLTAPDPAERSVSTADRFRSGTLDLGLRTSILFTNERDDGCFELAATGAQEPADAAPQVAAMLADIDDCPAMLAGFEAQAATLPRHCLGDADCAPFYVHPDACEAPLILNKNAQSNLAGADFRALQHRAQTACESRWPPPSACARQVSPVQCSNGWCAEGAVPEPVTMNFSSAVLSRGCAPHDAPATTITISAEDEAYPQLIVVWWRDGGSVPDDGRFSLNVAGSDLYAQGLQSTYCLRHGRCQMVVKLSLDLLLAPPTYTGRLAFSFTTDSGLTFSGSVPVRKRMQERRACG